MLAKLLMQPSSLYLFIYYRNAVLTAQVLSVCDDHSIDLTQWE